MDDGGRSPEVTLAHRRPPGTTIEAVTLQTSLTRLAK
jgi:hypothetical protein